MVLDRIVSKNLVRRDLHTAGQRAGLALEYEKFHADAMKKAEVARKRQPPAKTPDVQDTEGR